MKYIYAYTTNEIDDIKLGFLYGDDDNQALICLLKVIFKNTINDLDRIHINKIAKQIEYCFNISKKLDTIKLNKRLSELGIKITIKRFVIDIKFKDIDLTLEDR